LVADINAEGTLNRRSFFDYMPNKVENFLYEKESYQVRGACMDVWKQFKGMFKESVIDNSLTIALEERGLKVDSQKRINIYFHNKKVGTYIPDKVINDIIIFELKSKDFLTKQDEEQFWNYLQGSEYKLGFLVNFSPKKLDIRRVVYDTARTHNSATAQR